MFEVYPLIPRTTGIIICKLDALDLFFSWKNQIQYTIVFYVDEGNWFENVATDF